MKNLASLGILLAFGASWASAGELIFQDGFESGDTSAWSDSVGEDPGFCPSYEDSPYYRTPLRQVLANPSNWISSIENALAGDEILLEDGSYDLDQYAVQINVSELTVRSASGNRDAVVITGQGYGTGGEGFMIRSTDAHLADFTVTDIRNHGVSIKGESGAERPVLYNLHLFDIGTQHIKGTPGDGVEEGVVACSRIGYTPTGVQGDYINAIDIHRGIDWVVRDNVIYNLWGDGSGCEVDIDCGTYERGGGPAILFWNSSSGTLVERNRILDSFRGIYLGWGSNHPGGLVKNNFFFQSEAGRTLIGGFVESDTGMHFEDTQGTVVEHNTIILGSSTYPGAIELKDSSAMVLRNNLMNRGVWDRGGNSGAAETGNRENAGVGDFLVWGGVHLRGTSAAIDDPLADPVIQSTSDIDGDARPQGAGPDVGADER